MKAQAAAEALDAILRADASMFERYNVSPTQTVPVVRHDDKGKRELVGCRWGLVPHWMKPTDKGGIPTGPINARSETAADKPMFRSAMKRRRCLVPATGFYEWRKSDKPKAPKQPFLIERADRDVFAFAGLWERWTSPDGDDVDTYCILTTSPNQTMKAIHDRMPVILDPDEYDPWLDVSGDDAAALADLLDPLPDGLLDITPIATTINSPRNEGPEAVQPVPDQ